MPCPDPAPGDPAGERAPARGRAEATGQRQGRGPHLRDPGGRPRLAAGRPARRGRARRRHGAPLERLLPPRPRGRRPHRDLRRHLRLHPETRRPWPSATASGSPGRSASSGRPATKPTSPSPRSLMPVTRRGAGAAVAAAVVLGPSGRAAPARVVADGVSGDVEALPALRTGRQRPRLLREPGEHARPGERCRGGRAAGRPGELPVLPENGAGVDRRTVRGGLLAAPPGEAPPRIILADGAVRTPPASLGDRFPGQTTGIVDYAFGGYRVRVDELPSLVLGGLQPERAGAALPDTLSVATFNVENLSARESRAKLARLAETIVERLGSPDLLVLQEIQDDSGAADDGVVTGVRSAGALDRCHPRSRRSGLRVPRGAAGQQPGRRRARREHPRRVPVPRPIAGWRSSSGRAATQRRLSRSSPTRPAPISP